ncbi:MAG: N-acetylglucosamine-6-phosphate deacetylase [Flavisolibacter sp.]
MLKILAFNKIFTGIEILNQQAVVIKDGRIEQVSPLNNAEGLALNYEYFNQILVPSFVDLQVYGADGFLFSAYPTAETLFKMNNAFYKSGTTLFMPTVATNTFVIFKQCIDAVRTYWKAGGKGVHGLHLEGPWLNPEKRGAHLKQYIQEPMIHQVKEILQYGSGVIRMVTIAPEMCNTEIINLFQSEDIIISAGHSNASYGQAVEGFGKGIHLATHLYNAMSPLHHREPGITGAILDNKAVKASIVPDGYHVDFSAIRIAKKIMGERLFAITDAVTETTIGPYQHHLNGNKYESNGILSGSALSMHKAFTNLVQSANIPFEEAHRMCSLYPAEILKQDQFYGKIAPGYGADLVLLHQDLSLFSVLNG